MKNLRYIGPFFRMNSLSEKEINGQLFYLSKEAVKTIVLQSKCGLVSKIRKNKSSSSIDISTNSNFSPLLCVYRKSSSNFIHSKNSNGFDEDTFKKEINPSTNALMTLCLLELLDYYRSFENIDSNNYDLYTVYNTLAKEQLEFYSSNLRNGEGVFIDKKNLLENNSKNFNLVDKDNKFKFSDQAFMMIAYYIFSVKNPKDDISATYAEFASQILKMFCDFKDKLYECSLDEICKVLLSLNILYDYKNDDEIRDLIKNKVCDINPESLEFATNTRQQECLRQAKTSLEIALEATQREELQDLISIDIKSALLALDELTGEVVTDEVLNNIFDNFCIGK